MCFFVPRFPYLDKGSIPGYHNHVKKEVIIAIIVGFLVGSVAAFSIVHFPSWIKSGDTEVTTQLLTPSPIPPITGIAQASLTVDEPKDETVVSSGKLTVSGKTLKGRVVVVDTDVDSTLAAVSDDGSYKADITVTEGGTPITVTSYNDKGEAETKTISVVYAKEDL